MTGEKGEEDPPRKESIVSSEGPQENDPRRKEDAKAIFIQNVDYKTTKEQLELIFEDCGSISRVTLNKDYMTKKPKGNAFMSFERQEDVDMAINLSGTKHKGRIIKVQRKRTNIRGMSKTNNGPTQFFSMNMFQMPFGKPRGRGR